MQAHVLTPTLNELWQLLLRQESGYSFVFEMLQTAQNKDQELGIL